MSANFSDLQWQKINHYFDSFSLEYDLPERSSESVLLATFNIRKLGKIDNRTEQSWAFLKKILLSFDLIAVQEIMDDLSGFEFLVSLLGDDYGMVVSDVTGAKPGSSGNTERLGFIFNWHKIQRTALASDISYDRSEIAKNLYEHQTDFNNAWLKHTRQLKKWQQKVSKNHSLGKRAPSKPALELPRFVSFIRQPHCVSFRIKGENGQESYDFLIINAHLLYGKNKREREWEFRALLEWLTIRAKYIDKLYHPNLLLLGDCNLDFDTISIMREEVDAFLKSLNSTILKSRKSASANFPLLTPHPQKGNLVTALRQKQTYDQIGLFSNDPRLPKPDDNKTAGQIPGAYDYGVFNIANLIANALHQKNIGAITLKQKKEIYKKAEYDISDHMPAWFRLKIPGS